MPVFNDFDFQISLARRRGANFVDVNFQKCSEHANFLRFWFPNRSHAQAWCQFCRHLGQPILRTTSLFGPTFASLRSHATTEKHSISRNSYPPKISHVSRLRCKTSLLSNIEPARPTGNFQYSRKLELLNFLWLDIYIYIYINTLLNLAAPLLGHEFFLSTGSKVAPLDGGFFAVKPSGCFGAV